MQVDGSTQLWVASRALLHKRGEDFFMLLERALKTSDAEDIHDLRVASRRLREGMALFAPCYPDGDIARLVKRLKLVTRLLGEIRNRDEAVLFFSALAAEVDEPCRDALQGVIASFRKGRKKELKRLRSGLRDMASTKFRKRARRVISASELFSVQRNGIELFVPLSRFAAAAFAERLDAIAGLLPAAMRKGEVEAQHLLRIAIKHLRYRMEILSFLVGPHYGELHDTLRGYQDLLGRMHDLQVFAGIIREARISFEIEKELLDAMAAKSDSLFADFSEMLLLRPFAGIGERLERESET